MDNMNLGESIKKLLLAGVGAAVTTAEKSKELLDDLVEKGALTVEQGKMINEELKHNIKETVKEHRAAAKTTMFYLRQRLKAGRKIRRLSKKRCLIWSARCHRKTFRCFCSS